MPFFPATRWSHGSRGSPIIAPHRKKPDGDNQGLLTILISLLTLTTFVGLFVLRSHDDNRLTSWRWVFAGADLVAILLLLAAGIVVAYAISRITFPQRGRAAMLFVASFAIAALFWGEPEVNVDAARYFMQAKHLELYGTGYFLRQWGRGIAAWTDLPLVPFLHGLVFTVFGETRIAVQAFTTLVFSATVVLTYLTGRTLWDETTGACAGVLLLAMPYLLTQPALMLVDVPTMFFLTLAVYTTLKGIRHGGVCLPAAAVAITLALLSKYSTWVMLSVIPVIFLTHLEYGRRTVLRRATIISLATLLLAGAALSMKSGVIADQLKLLWNYQVPGVARWGESHMSTFLFQIHPFVTIAALCSIFLAVARRDIKYAIIGWMLLVIIVLGVRRSRYILVTFPMLALMAAYGLREIADGKTRRFVVSCAVASSLVTALFGFLPFLKGTSAINLMRAGEYLDSLDVDRAEVITLPRTRSIVNPSIAVPILDLFTGKRIVHQANQEPPPARSLIETSPLRFTWEFHIPAYFAPGADSPRDKTALVVIAGRNGQPLPPRVKQRLAGYSLSREFAVADRVFRFKTVVRVYLPR